ncbi:MAG: hypothetical protein P9M14_05995 [Candidatus Alcyoniella australis]|nr:hypothetical protein [Candidatus Alcyoniella australis]
MRKVINVVPVIGLIALLAMHLWLGLAWIAQTTHPGGVDEVTNLNWTFRFHHTLANHAYDDPLRFVLGSEHFLTTPPLLFMLSSLGFRAMDPSWATCLLVPLGSLLLWIFAGYLLAARLAGRWAGLTAAALIGSGPMAYLFGRTYNTSCLAAALITLALWAQVSSDGLRRLWPSLLIGPLIGLALIAERATPAVALAGPTLVLFAAALIRARHDAGQLRRAIALTVLATAVALALSLPFLRSYIEVTWQHNAELMRQPVNQVAGPWDADRPGWFYYLNGLITAQQVPLVALAALLGLVPLLVHRRVEGLALLAWLALPLIFFAPIAQRSLNYTFSIAAALCVIAAAGPALMQRSELQWPKRATLALLLILGVLKPLDCALGWRVLHVSERTSPDSLLQLVVDPTQFQIPEPSPLSGYFWEPEVERMLADNQGDQVLFLRAEPGYAVENSRILFALALAQRPTLKAYMLHRPCAALGAQGLPNEGEVSLLLAPIDLKTSQALAARLSYDTWGAAEYSRDLDGATCDAVCAALGEAVIERRPDVALGNGRTLSYGLINGGLNWP